MYKTGPYNMAAALTQLQDLLVAALEVSHLDEYLREG
jgi:hypothetical protein